MCRCDCDCSECCKMICDQRVDAQETHIFDPDNFYEYGGDDEWQ